MKNLTSSYINHPEAFYIFLTLLFIFMLIVPCLHLLIAIKKRNKFDSLVLKFNPINDYNNFTNLQCNLCRSIVKIKESIMNVPEEVNFSFFFIKENGYKKLNLCRCANCNSKLFYYIEKSSIQ